MKLVAFDRGWGWLPKVPLMCQYPAGQLDKGVRLLPGVTPGDSDPQSLLNPLVLLHETFLSDLGSPHFLVVGPRF